MTFSGHEEKHRVVIDHTRDGRPAALVPPSWFRRRGEPTYLLQRDGTTQAALWLEEAGRVEIRNGRSEQDRPAGRVDPSWQDGSIYLTFTPVAGSPYRAGPFRRVVTGGGPGELTRRAQTVLDVRGTFQADLLDAAGKPVGWWRLRNSPYQAAPRIYDAVLPDDLDLALTVATAVALGTEVDWIEAHVLDVYRGDSSGGKLERSIPLGH